MVRDPSPPSAREIKDKQARGAPTLVGWANLVLQADLESCSFEHSRIVGIRRTKRLTENGTPSVQFNYTNFNTPEETVMVGITSLRPDLRGTPDDPEDDLHLNSIVDSSGTPIVPDATYRAPSPNDQEQVFSESGSFLIPFDPLFGSVKWTLLGTEVAVNGSTQLCRDEGLIACQPVPISGLRSLTEYAQVTVAKYLQAATRQARNSTKFKGATD